MRGVALALVPLLSGWALAAGSYVEVVDATGRLKSGATVSQYIQKKIKGAADRGQYPFGPSWVTRRCAW
jgi:hypothetical protein